MERSDAVSPKYLPPTERVRSPTRRACPLSQIACKISDASALQQKNGSLSIDTPNCRCSVSSPAAPQSQFRADHPKNEHITHPHTQKKNEPNGPSSNLCHRPRNGESSHTCHNNPKRRSTTQSHFARHEQCIITNPTQPRSCTKGSTNLPSTRLNATLTIAIHLPSLSRRVCIAR